MTTDPLARAQASLDIARDGALATVLRLAARLETQQAEIVALRSEIARLRARIVELEQAEQKVVQ